jgi:hypothetical protein
MTILSTAPFLMVGLDPTVPNGRALAAGTGLTLQDTGPLSTLTIEPVGNLNNVANFSTQGLLSYSSTTQNFSGVSLTPGAGIEIANEDGSTGSPTFSVIPSSTVQLTNVKQAGADRSVRSTLNFIGGDNTNVSVVDNPTLGSADISISLVPPIVNAISLTAGNNIVCTPNPITGNGIISVTPSPLRAVTQVFNVLNYTALSTDSFLSVNTFSSGGPVSITLPSFPSTGQNYTIVDNAINAAKNPITIDSESWINPTFINNVGTLNAPQGMAQSGTYFYLVNTGNENISIYSGVQTGTLVFVGTFSNANLKQPNNIAVSGTYLYVTNNDSTISIFTGAGTSTLTFLSVISGNNLNQPHGIAVSGTYLYVANTEGNTISSFTGADTGSLTVASLLGNVGLNGPFGITISGKYLYVANTLGNNVLVFEGVELGTLTLIWNYPGTFNAPNCIALSLPYFYCTNNNSTISIYSQSFTINQNSGSLNLTYDGTQWLSTL